jgi:hypothetical protein
LPNLCDFQEKIHRLGFKNLYKIYRLAYWIFILCDFHLKEEENDAEFFSFLTPAGEIMDSVEAAVEYLTDNGKGKEVEEEVKRLLQLQEKERLGSSGGSRGGGAKYDWEEDPTVPAGTKTDDQIGIDNL